MKDNKSELKINRGKKLAILVMSFVIALSLAITCAVLSVGSNPVSVDTPDTGEVSASATYTNPGSGSNYSATMQNGQSIAYTTAGYRTVTLGKGTYTLDVRGAQGGTYSGAGGKGGISRTTLTITSTTKTLYIAVGGAGTNGNSSNTVKAGGYNGGGQGRYYGSGGGGATHIATTARGSGVLSAYNSYRNEVMIVAGGGGGSQRGAGGAGGGANQSGGSGSGSYGSAGGGASTSGAGGGGYFGGGGARTDYSGVDDKGGGGGSGYVNPGSSALGYTTSSTSGSSGSQAGTGYVLITATNVNQAPVARSATLSGGNRGSKTLDITASQVAYDNNSGQTVYFSQGLSNRDTAPRANNDLWLNSSHTLLATNYLTWQWVSTSAGTTTLRITDVKRYPRSGVDGSTLNGRLTLYAYVRDNYGSNTTRGLTNVVFYLTINDQGIQINSARTVRKTDTAQGNYEYRLGKSNNTSTTLDYINNTSAIYNTSQNKDTVFIPQPLTPARTNGFRIDASDLFNDIDSTKDRVGIKSVSTDGNSAYYKIEYHAISGVSGLSDYILIKPTTLRPTKAVFAVLTITAQDYETATKAVLVQTNATLQLTFKIANTRPYYASTDTSVCNTGIAEPLITLNPGEFKDLKISEFAKDVDNNALTYATAANETSIKVPINEFVPVTYENAAIRLQGTSNYYGKGSPVSNTSTTGEGNTPTGFNANTKMMLAAAGTTAASTANVTYSYINSTTLRITARAATQYQYKTSGRKGDFYFMVRIIDAGDTNDGGIWFPIAIKVNSTAPHEPATTANFELAFKDVITNTEPDGVNAKDPASTTAPGSPSTVILTPISYMSGSTLKGIGALEHGNISESTAQALPFVTDDDGFQYPGTGVGTVECTYKLNDIITLAGVDKSDVITADGTGAFFRTELVKLYASSKVFAALSDAQLTAMHITKDTADYYSFWGIQVTALSGTDNNYYQFKVIVNDSHNRTSNVRVYVKVDNRDVSVRRNPSADTNYPFYADESGNDYTVRYVGSNNSLGMWYMNYKIEKTDVLYITPYDLAFDFDSAPAVNPDKNSFNSNPRFGEEAWNTAKNAITEQFSVFGTVTPSIAATAMTVKYNQLTFGGQSLFDSTKAPYTSYIDAQITEKDGVPCIMVTALSRTSANIPVLRFTVTDGFSSVDCAVGITVRNAAPVLASGLDDCYKLVAPSAGTTGTIDVNYSEFFVKGSGPQDSVKNRYGLTYDIDGDSPTFVAGTVKTVAKVGNSYFEYIKVADGKWTGATANDAGAVRISDYVYATLTKSAQSGTLGTDVIRVEARSSTQLFDVPVYMQFDVNDGYRADPRQPTLYVQIEVLNSDPVFVTSELEQTEDGNYVWNVQYNNVAEKGLSRYIINNEELYNSSAIAALPANKKLLFNDPDSRQSILFNPNSGTVTADNLVKQIDSETAIDENTFRSQSFSSAAVIYGKSYKDSSVGSPYLDVRILFYSKASDGSFSPITDGSTSPYWAIEITDRANTTSAFTPTQFAIAVKDDHYGNTVYDGSRESGSGSIDNTSKITVVNFYYNYISPGLIAMHEYYRTNGNAESKTVVSGSGSSALYMVDKSKLYNYQLNNGSNEGEYKGDQSSLATASFADDFKYQYFVNIYSSTINGTTNYEITPKTYPNAVSAGFWYKPIMVGSTVISVPLSYLAMPAVWTDSGTNGENEHVIFADKDKAQSANYMSWTLDDVVANMTLSDGKRSWTGSKINENPYIRIDYTSNANHVGAFDGNNPKFSYWNKMRGKLSDNKTFTADEKYQQDDSIFYEDKLGFTFVKNTGEGSARPSGDLRLTVKLKTTDSKSSTVDVGVDISVENAVPSIKSGSSEISIDMTMEDAVDRTINNETVTAGYTVKLAKGPEGGQHKAIVEYTDSDSTDVMKFYMPTATDGKLKDSRMSTAELKYLKSYSADSSALKNYFGDDYISLQTDEEKDNYISEYTPNPGYKNFFEVTPATGTSSVIQIIPKAKTQIDESKLGEYHLVKDTDASSTRKGKIYYPFKILCYDDLDGSGLTNGFWTCITIRVYIDNNKPEFINQSTNTEDNYISLKSSNDGEVRSYSRYSFTLTKGVAFTVDMTTLISDSDMAMNGLSYMTSGEAWATDTGEFTKLVKDRLVMPITGTTVNYTKMATANGTIPDAVPFTVSAVDSSKSSIRFETSNAFKIKYYLLFTFGDGTLTKDIAFEISYNNEAPTANSDTYGSGTLDIVMRNGDSFILHAADPTKFGNDANGGYLSPAAFTSNSSDYWDTTNNKATFAAGFRTDPTSAEDMKAAFKDAAHADYVPGNLGSLIVGSDDAPSTLRFGTSGQGSVVSIDGLNANKFTVTPGNYFRTENSLANASGARVFMPMSVKIEARGVVTNARLSLTVTDGSKTYTVSVFVTVLSSAPVVKTGNAAEAGQALPSDISKVEGETDTYRVDLAYGDTWEHQLKELFNDPDRGDDENFYMPLVYDGQSVSVSGVSTAVDVTQGAGTYNTLKIRAVDYISTENENNYAVIKFKVSDAHGVQSNEVTIRVYVSPNTATTRITEANRARIDLMSYAAYVDAGAATVIKLVDDSANLSDLMVYDRDVDAPSAFYDVAVYAMYKLDDSENVVACGRDEVTESALIIKREHSHDGTSEGAGKIYDYVNSFFTVQISEEGKSLLFMPKASTIGGGGTAPFGVGLFIEVKKNYVRRSGSTVDYTMDPVNVFANVSVANSLPVAVENSGLNYGYPTVTQTVTDNETGNTTTATAYRESDFLAFSGTAGDSLTWKLYDTQNQNYGLFYDYDMLKNAGGRESLTFIRGSVAERYTYTDDSGVTHTVDTPRDALSTTNPVLSISGDNDTHEVKITIRRKVYTGQATSEGAEASKVIPVEIVCADTLSFRANASANYAKTVILVTVENDPPEFNDITYDQTGRRYYVTHSDTDGYNLYASIRYNESVTVQLKDIITDQDFDMDSYSLVGDEGCLTENVREIYGVGGSERLFSFAVGKGSNSYDVSTIKTITFGCVSTSRGAEARTAIVFTDSTMTAKTSKLVIHLTVGNTAPQAKVDVSEFTLMGAAYVENDEGENISETPAAVTYNIVDYVSDINGDAVNALTSDSVTYVYISEIRTDERYAAQLYGPRIDSDINKGVEPPNTLCEIGWVETAETETHQQFGLTVMPGVYGTQYFILTVEDGGFIQGIDAGVEGSLSCDVLIKVTVACPISDNADELPTLEIAQSVTRTVTPELLLNTAEIPNAAAGYVITGIASSSSAVSVIDPNGAATSAAGAEALAEGESWRITGNYRMSEPTVIAVTFAAGEMEVVRNFNVRITENHAPVMKSIDNLGIYQTSQLMNNTITIRPEDWFDDEDIEDVMRFMSPVKVKVSAYATATMNGNNIVLTFLGRGTTDLTFNITDSTGTVYTHTISIGCSDMPELKGWNAIVANIQSKPILYGSIFGGVLLLIILIIIIAVVVHKKKKMRREIEALLASENELNEEMMRLSAANSVGYQPFAYLGQQQVRDPGLMLGGGATAPTTNNLQLGSGTGQNIGTTVQALPTGHGSAANTGFTQTQQNQTPPPQQQQRPPQYGAPQQQGMRPQQNQVPPQGARPANPQYGVPPQQQYPRTGSMPVNNVPPRNGNMPNGGYSDGFDPDSF